MVLCHAKLARTASIRDSSGFTLVEMLVTVAILAILTAMLGTAISTAYGVYRETTFVSQADVFESTVDSELGGLFKYSKISGGTQSAEGIELPAFTCASKGYQNAVIASSVPDGFGADSQLAGFLYVYSKTASGTEATPAKLVNAGAYTDLKVSGFQYQIDGGNAAEGFVISGSYTIESTRDSKLTRTVNFTYRTAG